MNKEAQIKAAANKYFDSMPPLSRTTFYQLTPYLCLLNEYHSLHVVREWIGEVIQSREDLVVYRGRGICKR